MADDVLALHRLQKLVGHAVQPEFTDVPDEYGDVDQIVRSFQLEKYLETIKAQRKHLDTTLQSEEWTGQREQIDSKIRIVEGVMVQRRKLHARYVMAQQVKAQSRAAELEWLSKPIDFSAFEPAQSPGAAASPVTPVAAAPAVPDKDHLVPEKEQLVRRRARPPPTKASREDEEPFRREHDQLGEDLVILAKNLKRNNQVFQDLLKKDKDVLKETELGLTTNAGRFEKEHGNLKQFRKTSWRSTKSLIVMMFLLFAAFIAMYLFIKVTNK